MQTILSSLPSWLLPLGWIILLAGWILGRPATAGLVNKITIFGSHNRVQTQISVAQPAPAQGESGLAKAASWATLLGLALSLLPMAKDLLK